ncbi:MAG: helix-turn-helix transcriptional regulator [Thermoplasmata archaeon]
MNASQNERPGDVLPTFSSTKREILLSLKRDGETDLGRLAGELSLTKMAVYRHVKDLEQRGLIERFDIRSGVGRPKLGLRLAPEASSLFPRAYSAVTVNALEFIEEELGREAVERALRRRQNAVLGDYEAKVGTGSLKERVAALARLRDEEGYMAESRGTPGRGYELLEFNCPILAVADRYGEACTVERELFQRVLDADVETTHRVVAGNQVCRFLIRPRKREWAE